LDGRRGTLILSPALPGQRQREAEDMPVAVRSEKVRELVDENAQV
jgi:hypothetical protein